MSSLGGLDEGGCRRGQIACLVVLGTHLRGLHTLGTDPRSRELRLRHRLLGDGLMMGTRVGQVGLCSGLVRGRTNDRSSHAGVWKCSGVVAATLRRDLAAVRMNERRESTLSRVASSVRASSTGPARCRALECVHLLRWSQTASRPRSSVVVARRVRSVRSSKFAHSRAKNDRQRVRVTWRSGKPRLSPGHRCQSSAARCRQAPQRHVSSARRPSFTSSKELHRGPGEAQAHGPHSRGR